MQADPYAATEDTFEIENDGIDFGADTSRKVLTSNKSDQGDIEMQTISQSHGLARKPPSDIIEACQQAYQDNPRPMKLGKMYCFWYDSKNRPRIVVGPDWYFSLFEIILVNGICSAVLYPAYGRGLTSVFLLGLGVVLF